MASLPIPACLHGTPMRIMCFLTLPRRAKTDLVALCEGARAKGGGQVSLHIHRPSCLKAFTPSPPLTPLPCRIDSGCDMVQVISRRCSAPFVRPGAGKNETKGSCAAGWLWGRAPEKALLHQEWAALSGELKSSGCCQVARMAAVRHRPGKSCCL